MILNLKTPLRLVGIPGIKGLPLAGVAEPGALPVGLTSESSTSYVHWVMLRFRIRHSFSRQRQLRLIRSAFCSLELDEIQADTHTSRMQVNKRGAVIHAEVWDTVHPKQFLVGAALALVAYCSGDCTVHMGCCGSCALETCIRRQL